MFCPVSEYRVLCDPVLCGFGVTVRGRSVCGVSASALALSALADASERLKALEGRVDALEEAADAEEEEQSRLAGPGP